VFLRDATRARGTVVIVPGGVSSARVTFGAVDFDTAVSLADSAVHLKDRPAPLGGILHVRPYSEFVVVGGDKKRLQVEPSPTPGLAWTTTPRFEVPCKGIEAPFDVRWPVAAMPAATATLYPLRPRIAVRATKAGPVVAHLEEVTGASEVAREGGAVQIRVELLRGEVLAWSDAADWTTTQPAPDADRDGRGGIAMGIEPRLACARGTELYVVRDDKIYAVGKLSTARTAQRDTGDWRFKDGKIVVEGRPFADPIPWSRVSDDFRVTNAYWNGGIDGDLIVPKSSCTVVTR
jgi:hypothetical protein